MTLVVIAIDDFSMRVETDAPEAPAWLLHVAEQTQAKMRRNQPEIDRAWKDLLLFGRARMPTFK